MGKGIALLTGEHPERGLLYAAIVPAVRFTEGKVGDSRLAAHLAPFRDEASALAALSASAAAAQTSLDPSGRIDAPPLESA